MDIAEIRTNVAIAADILDGIDGNDQVDLAQDYLSRVLEALPEPVIGHAAICGALCPEHGDPRDTHIVTDELPFVVGHNTDKGLPVTRHATLQLAEDRIEFLSRQDPEGVARGDYYIDGPEEIINGRR